MSDTYWDVEDAESKITVRRALMDKEDVRQMAVDILSESLPVVTMAMVHLAIHSPTESVRFNAGKYIMDRALGKVDDQISPDSRPAWEKIYDDVLVEAENIKMGGE